MEQSKTTAKDFFLHLGAIASLYAVAIAFVNLLFTVINEAYPQITQYYSYYNNSSISLPVATLIIIFPIFLVLSRIVHNIYNTEPDKKQIAVRRWLTYITLFVAGVILAGDLVTVLYKFLDGQDLTIAFVLKALVVFIVAGAIFKYYLDEIRDTQTAGRRKVWTIVSTLAILASIILGFSVIGSPATQRKIRYDQQKISDLQNIQWQIIDHWQKGVGLPQNITELSDPLSGFMLPKDPQTGENYEYKKIDNDSFELCANFNKESNMNASMAPTMIKAYGDPMSENWTHDVGRICFTRDIDLNLYPVVKRVI